MTAKLTKSYIRPNVYKLVIFLVVSKREIIINGCCFYIKRRKEETGKEMEMERTNKKKEKKYIKGCKKVQE
jgi:hypothetical protein